jgi:uncharacterized membrane protein YfcA
VTLAFALTLIAIGVAGAFVSGLVGVGGAIVMIPLLLYVPPLLGVGSLEVKHVAGVTMTQVLVSALVGVWQHGRSAVVVPVARIGGTSMALGSLIGGVGSGYVSGRILLGVFAVMATTALLLMAVPPPVPLALERGEPVRFSRPKAATYPFVIGVGSGLVGAGGAFLLMPALIGLLRIPIRASIGTSLAITAISASAGFLGKAMTGQVPLAPAALVVAASLAGVPLGVRASQAAPEPVLRAVLLGLIIAVMLRVWADVLLGPR